MDETTKATDAILVAALSDVGVHVISTQELLTRRAPYAAAVPVLVKYLPLVENIAVKEVLVRALGTKYAKGLAEEALIREFDRTLDDTSADASALRWAIANTFDLLAGGRGVDERLLQLALDPRSGSARGLLAVAAAKAKAKDAIPTLITMLDDSQLTPFAARGLGLLRAKAAIPKLLELVESSNAFARREVRSALKRLGIPTLAASTDKTN